MASFVEEIPHSILDCICFEATKFQIRDASSPARPSHPSSTWDVTMSVDGKGRFKDNIFIERLGAH
jgi:hypothetical protein